ncbi:unnamed protein product [Echinostoma caproni]|uniref:4'-phosphopantetheine phosphatase n=1 Tax=Echinostoma caproni TaxID=27848 RepID=A0A183B853_9TREM|nr:unnamed protein product [Echinostoma caproni]
MYDIAPMPCKRCSSKLITTFTLGVTKLMVFFCDIESYISGNVHVHSNVLIYTRSLSSPFELNTAPAINDVTFQELEVLLRLTSSHVPTVAHALSSGRLLVAENGQTSPCLDLRLTASSLAHLVKREGVDLVVIEGMGRAIHTNLYARFRVDSLKVAVIKNSWLARRLGGQLYGVVFKFESVQSNRISPNRENTPTTTGSTESGCSTGTTVAIAHQNSDAKNVEQQVNET